MNPVPLDEFPESKRDPSIHAGEITRRDDLRAQLFHSLPVKSTLLNCAQRQINSTKTIVFNLSHRGHNPKHEKPSVRILAN